MSYLPRPNMPGYWMYDGRPVQAAIETHRFCIEYAERVSDRDLHILDIAAGSGALSKALLDRGLRVACTSWDDRVNLPIDIYRLNLDHPFSPDDVGGVYDLVFGIEIIEHLENPAAFLRSCRGILAPFGHLILSTPNVENVAARLQWLKWGSPRSFQLEEVTKNRHISLLWREGLEYHIGAAGLEVVELHLLGAPRLKGILQTLLKRPLYWILERLLRGQPRGTTKLYVLKRSGTVPRSLGPGEVY